jgi:aminopeptidase
MMARMVEPAQLDRYADLALQVGVGLRPGQRLVVRSPVEAAPLVRALAGAAYRLGAPYVTAMWSDPEIARLRYELAPDGTFEEVPYGEGAALAGMAERGDAFVSIDANDPELLRDADAERVATARAAAQRSLRPFRRFVMNGGVAWTILAAATPAWAAKVFPEDEADTATARLWQAIFAAVRLDAGDPVAAWREHVAALEARSEHLNARRYRALRFRGAGTDLTVGLAEAHLWRGGQTVTNDGRAFVPNLPTEEVFTAPHRDRVDGTARASLPLAYAGRVIEGLWLRFREGRVIEAGADAGEEVLARLLDSDDGARRLGEVALVSVDSPIRRSGRLFFDTLFDENAASHLALGEAYRICTEGGEALDDEEAAARGLNASLTHVDFMIGGPETDVDGIRAGRGEEPVMRGGRFVV